MKRSIGRTSTADSEGESGSFPLTHLDKVFFPAEGYTKGDVLEYYRRIAPQILPVINDRPLALKRYPTGIAGPFFFQQNAPPPDRVPPGVRVESVPAAGDGTLRPRFVGGSLATLLYTVQLGCIGVDPWHGRIRSLATADYTIIDLDPGTAVPFSRTVEVALWVKSDLDAAGLHAVAKTSGSRGIHIYLPLPPRATAATALALAQSIATRVAEAHPRAATVTRDLGRRPPDTVYMDYLQNARGKTVAAAYGLRAVPGARVSMPLQWSEITPTLDPGAFTLRTAVERIARLGDIWATGMADRNTAAAVKAAIGRK